MTDWLVARLRKQAVEVADEGHNGWGNTMLSAADEIERLQALAEVDGPLANPGGFPARTEQEADA